VELGFHKVRQARMLPNGVGLLDTKSRGQSSQNSNPYEKGKVLESNRHWAPAEYACVRTGETPWGNNFGWFGGRGGVKKKTFSAAQDLEDHRLLKLEKKISGPLKTQSRPDARLGEETK